jgi:hypothetical protein
MENQLHATPQRPGANVPPEEDHSHTAPPRAGLMQNANLYREQLCAVVLAASPFQSSIFCHVHQSIR